MNKNMKESNKINEQKQAKKRRERVRKSGMDAKHKEPMLNSGLERRN